MSGRNNSHSYEIWRGLGESSLRIPGKLFARNHVIGAVGIVHQKRFSTAISDLDIVKTISSALAPGTGRLSKDGLRHEYAVMPALS